ncbi:unnamed protein product, partial [Porites evermanni]
MIIARFLRYANRERVMKNAFKLKETDFKIFEDLPKGLFSLRKKYLPDFYENKKAGKKAVFSKSEPDKLFIDGTILNNCFLTFAMLTPLIILANSADGIIQHLIK